MVKLLPTHIFSTHFLVLLMLAIASPCVAHEGEAGGVFDLIATQRYERRSDGVDSHVALLGSLEDFHAKVAGSRLPVVVQFLNGSSRAWGGIREQYQNLAGEYVGKVLFISVDTSTADEVVKRFLGLFLQLALQAKQKSDAYSNALQHRLATLLQQLLAIRKGDAAQQVYLFFKDGHLIIPQTEKYASIRALQNDVHKQLLSSKRAHVLKVPLPWQQPQPQTDQLALHHTGDLGGLAKRLRVQLCSNN